ncbi:MAG: biotin/lipoyl-containing protein [Nitrososphaerales archaeon]
MLVDVIIPELGLSSTSVFLSTWKKMKGDRVSKGEPLYSMETEKVNMDIPSPATGILVEILIEGNREIPVGQKIAIIKED